MAELIEELVDMALKQLQPTSAAEVQTDTTSNSKTTRHIPESVKSAIRLRDENKCQYVDPLTKRKCQSRFKIQLDHIHPRGLGGDNGAENLRLLCQSHNLLRATQVYTKRYMEKYLRK